MQTLSGDSDLDSSNRMTHLMQGEKVSPLYMDASPAAAAARHASEKTWKSKLPPYVWVSIQRTGKTMIKVKVFWLLSVVYCWWLLLKFLQHAHSRVCSSMQVRYKEDFEKMKGQSLFVPGAELIHSKNISAVISEVGACYKDLPGTKLSVKNFAWKVSPCHFFLVNCDNFSRSIRRRERRRRRSLCTPSCLKLQRLSMPERRQSCRAR